MLEPGRQLAIKPYIKPHSQNWSNPRLFDFTGKGWKTMEKRYEHPRKTMFSAQNPWQSIEAGEPWRPWGPWDWTQCLSECWFVLLAGSILVHRGGTLLPGVGVATAAELSFALEMSGENGGKWHEVTWSDGCKKNKEMNTMPPWLLHGKLKRISRYFENHIISLGTSEPCMFASHCYSTANGWSNWHSAVAAFPVGAATG